MSVQDRTAEQILGLLIAAAGNGDVVRLAVLIGEGDAEQPFTRAQLVEWWSQAWPHHFTRPGPRPDQRVNRALPNLIGAEVISGLQGGTEMTVINVDRLGFLFARDHHARDQDAHRPHNLSLPVGAATRAAAAALVPGLPDPAPVP